MFPDVQRSCSFTCQIMVRSLFLQVHIPQVQDVCLLFGRSFLLLLIKTVYTYYTDFLQMFMHENWVSVFEEHRLSTALLTIKARFQSRYRGSFLTTCLNSSKSSYRRHGFSYQLGNGCSAVHTKGVEQGRELCFYCSVLMIFCLVVVGSTLGLSYGPGTSVLARDIYKLVSLTGTVQILHSSGLIHILSHRNR